MKRTIPIAKPVLGREKVEAVRKVFESGVLVQGERIRLFEKEFAEYIGVEHAVAVANGILALDVALKALKLGPGDEVVTSAFCARKRVLSLPVHPSVNEDDIAYILNVLREVS